MTSFEVLLSEASKLPADQKLALAQQLLASAEPEGIEDVDQAWNVEINERIARYDRGESTARPASEVFSKAR